MLSDINPLLSLKCDVCVLSEERQVFRLLDAILETDLWPQDQEESTAQETISNGSVVLNEDDDQESIQVLDWKFKCQNIQNLNAKENTWTGKKYWGLRGQARLCIERMSFWGIYQSDTYGRVANEVTEPPGLNEVESSKIKPMNL